MLEGLLNEKNSSCYGTHVFLSKKPRGEWVYNQSNLRSKDFEDIAIFLGQLNLWMLKKMLEQNLTKKIYEIKLGNIGCCVGQVPCAGG